MAIGDVRIHAEANVGGQRPGRGRPGQVGGVLIQTAEAHRGAFLADILIALGHLVGGKSRAAAGAIGHHLVPLIKQALFVDGFEGPPFGFDVIILIGNVGVVHVGPEAHTVAHLFPFAFIFPNGFFALFDKGHHAIGFDLLLAVEAQLALYLQLHGQAVRIPARLAQHVVALHGAVAGDDILDGPGEDMADVGLAVGRRRPVVEGIGRRTAAQLHALFKNALLFPKGQRGFFAFCKVEGCGNLFIHIVSPAVFLCSTLYIREKRRFCKASVTDFSPFSKDLGFEVDILLCYYDRDTICSSVACFFCSLA